MLLSQLPMTFMLQQLTQNPSTTLFSFSTSDYPNGVTRTALLAAWQIAVQNNGLYDSTTGAFNTQAYAPGILTSAGEQIPASPAATMQTQTVPTGLVASANVNNPISVSVNGATPQGSSPAMVNSAAQVK